VSTYGLRTAPITELPHPGKSVSWLSSPVCKNISIHARPKSVLEPRRLVPHEGRIAIVTDAGWDAVDAAASGA
jgi:hypothetical protein